VFVLRVLVPRLALFSAASAMVAAGYAMSPHLSAGASTSGADRAGSLPAWSAADEAAHPECTPAGDWPEGKAAPAVVVQVVRDSVHRRLAFDATWRRNHNRTEVDDVWVLGICD
jgi:hypothetical protein